MIKAPYILQIQKYSIHDGGGIRTTVFFKGCPLHCAWCHNPESISYQPELLFERSKCIGCEACVEQCPEQAIQLVDHIAVTDASRCAQCKSCEDHCIRENREIVGETMDLDKLIKMIEKDRAFYETSHGGVTLSGGEVMSQPIDYMLELVKRLKRRGIHIAVDTCGYAPLENYQKLLPFVDVFLYDIKMMDKEKHQKYTGKENALILENLKWLSDHGANLNIRIPVIKPVNSDIKSMQAIADFLNQGIHVPKINLLPYHNTGSGKYDKMEKEYQGKEFETPSHDEMQELKSVFENQGFKNVEIGG